MAKILYGVQSEGMGHAIRSRAIIDNLSRDNDIIVVASPKVCSYFSRYCKGIKSLVSVQNYAIVYDDNKASSIKTMAHNFLHKPWDIYSFFRVASVVMKEKPDVIITDFEHLTAYLGWIFRIPVLSVDNEHIISNAHISSGDELWLDLMKSRITMKAMVPRADRYIVSSFFFPLIKNDKTILVGPLLREKILSLKPRHGNHILVYQTSSSSLSLIPSLQRVGEKFIVYGMKRKGKEGSIIFKEFNEDSFFDDLAGCKAVIMNGSFTLMTEALYLKKPVFAVPVEHQFEQALNSIYLKKLGYGIYSHDFSPEKMSLFLKSLSKYRKNLSRYSLVGNRKAVKEIRKFISLSSRH